MTGVQTCALPICLFLEWLLSPEFAAACAAVNIEPVRAVRRTFGDNLLLQVDANSAYSVGDAEHLAKLDEFDLLLIEQPLPEEQVAAHAELVKTVRTPICLDESILSAEVAREAIDIGACTIINIKPGRVGVPEYNGQLADVVRSPRYSTVLGLLTEAKRQYLRGQVVVRQGGSATAVWQRMKEWFLGNF